MKVDLSIVVENGGKYVTTKWVNDGEESARSKLFQEMIESGEIEPERIMHDGDENMGCSDYVVTVEILRAWFARCEAEECPVRREAIELLDDVNETVRLTLRGRF